MIGAEIGGTDAQPVTQSAQATAQAADAERTQIAKELTRPDLPARERATLRDQQATSERQRREAEAAPADARASVATTPMSFSYRAGSGVGLSARLADAWQMATGSLGLTIGFALTATAALGPPAMLLIVLALLWLRLGRRWWKHLADAAA